MPDQTTVLQRTTLPANSNLMASGSLLRSPACSSLAPCASGELRMLDQRPEAPVASKRISGQRSDSQYRPKHRLRSVLAVFLPMRGALHARYDGLYLRMVLSYSARYGS